MKSTIDRLGYYLVDGKKFHNKPLALIESKRTFRAVSWVFNDDVYGKFDWTLPISESLTSLYKRRAQQLREQYDYLVLYFSGGADSMNILHAFVDNNIFLDEIVMQLPEPTRPTFDRNDTSNKNIYGELEFAAVPHLKKIQHLLNTKTKIRYQDFSKPVFDLLEHDDWFESNPTGTNFCISGIARQYAQVSEGHILKLCEQRQSVAQIVGVDKPMVSHDGTRYYAYFNDGNAMHAPPITQEHSEVFRNYYHTEFFYWTPDMPEIVIKQAQEVKRYYESHPRGVQLAQEFTKKHIQDYRPILHPIIYPSYITVEFETEKPTSKIIRSMDTWFWNLAEQRHVDNYFNVIKYLKDNIHDFNFTNNDISNGFVNHYSKRYYL